MAWQPHAATEAMTWLRFMVRGTLVLSSLILGMLLVWFTARFSWHFVEFLERTIFSGPW